jgi:hypothetical protein
MSRRRRSTATARRRHRLDDGLEAIALRIHQIAATLGLLAEGQHEPNLSHTLYLIEQCLLETEARLAALYDVPAAPPAGRAPASRPRRVGE